MGEGKAFKIFSQIWGSKLTTSHLQMSCLDSPDIYKSKFFAMTIVAFNLFLFLFSPAGQNRKGYELLFVSTFECKLFKKIIYRNYLYYSMWHAACHNFACDPNFAQNLFTPDIGK